MTERRDAPSLLQQVRAHAKARDSIAWSGQARQLLLWAADTIEAANAALRSETAPHYNVTGPLHVVCQCDRCKESPACASPKGSDAISEDDIYREFLHRCYDQEYASKFVDAVKKRSYERPD